MFLVFGLAQLGGAVAIGLLGRLLAPTVAFEGCDPGVLGLVAGFGLTAGGLRLSLFGAVEMSGRTLMWILLGLSGLSHLAHGDFVSLGGGAVGALVGWAVAKETLPMLWDRLRLRWLRRRYKVLEGGARSARGPRGPGKSPGPGYLN